MTINHCKKKTYLREEKPLFEVRQELKPSEKIVGRIDEFNALEEDNARGLVFKNILGQSRAVKKIIASTEKISALDTVVFIQGETGTGKELIAKAIHNLSPRANKPMVTINCGALTETLLDSELFGHVKGAFTSADTETKGLFEAAEGGTIFLDEIGEMTLGTQVKLLRVLQDGEIRKLGSTVSKKVNVRIITATHRDLETLIDEGKFREDLFYRIHVFTIHTPPLRDREEDIFLLAENFLKEFSEKQNKTTPTLSEQARKVLLAHTWPGNVRELRNVIERASVLCESDILQVDDLLLSFNKIPEEDRVRFKKGYSLLGENKIENINGKILACLEKNRWNKTITAKELNISRATLWRKIKDLS
jgi:transcriptional regulator with PAS, ATPase and Fis domain